MKLHAGFFFCLLWSAANEYMLQPLPLYRLSTAVANVLPSDDLSKDAFIEKFRSRSQSTLDFFTSFHFDIVFFFLIS